MSFAAQPAHDAISVSRIKFKPDRDFRLAETQAGDCAVNDYLTSRGYAELRRSLRQIVADKFCRDGRSLLHGALNPARGQ